MSRYRLTVLNLLSVQYFRTLSQLSLKQISNIMKTTLPTLSYLPTGIEWSEEVHSSAYTKKRYPRTDLKHFVPWDTFEAEINQAIDTRMFARNIPPGTEYDIGGLPKSPPRVANEEGVRQVAANQLHDLVVEVLEILGIEGWFSMPDTGNNHIVGGPDYSWLRFPAMHPKVVVEYKTKWAAPLEDLPAYFHKAHKSALEQQSTDALFQLYGYMMFNENKYGILNNMEHAWFFQRVETTESQGKTLQYYGPIKFDSVHSPSMLKAFVGTILLAETTSVSFHSCPTSAKVPPGRYFGTSPTAIHNRDVAIAQAKSYKSVVVDGSYEVLTLDPRLCHFHSTSVRHPPQGGFTLKVTLVRGNLAGGNLNVFGKVVDLFQRRDSIDALDMEVRNYATLEDLQGKVIPRVCGYYGIWGLLRLLALEDVGTAIPKDEEIDTQTRDQMRSALARIHSAGYVHGDIARRNFCKKANMVFLVDLETLAEGSPVEMAAELAQLDAL